MWYTEGKLLFSNAAAKIPKAISGRNDVMDFHFQTMKFRWMSQQEENPSRYTRTLVVKPALSQMYDQLLPKSKSLETACKNPCTRTSASHHGVYLDLGISQMVKLSEKAVFVYSFAWLPCTSEQIWWQVWPTFHLKFLLYDTVFTEDASPSFLYHGAKNVKNDRNLKLMGGGGGFCHSWENFTGLVENFLQGITIGLEIGLLTKITFWSLLNKVPFKTDLLEAPHEKNSVAKLVYKKPSQLLGCIGFFCTKLYIKLAVSLCSFSQFFSF